MKKIMSCLLVAFAVFFMFNTVNAKEEIKITNLKCENMNGGIVKEGFSAKVDGLTIKVDDTNFSEVNDYMKCTFTINNNTSEDVRLDYNSISKMSNENITYSLTGLNQKIKKYKSEDYTLDIKYKKAFYDNKVITNNVAIKVSSNTGIINNPNTNSTVVVIILVSAILILSTLLVANKKAATAMVLVAVLGIVPSAYALRDITINFENKIIVSTESYTVSYRLYSSDFYVKEKDLEKYDLTQMDPMYYGPTIYYEGESYVNFKKPLILVDGPYGVGQTVTAKPAGYYEYRGECSVDEYNSLICDYRMEYKTLSAWKYASKYNPDMQEDDLETMKFSNIYYNDWAQNHTVYLSANGSVTFTMPKHDVVLRSDTN